MDFLSKEKKIPQCKEDICIFCTHTQNVAWEETPFYLFYPNMCTQAAHACMYDAPVG